MELHINNLDKEFSSKTNIIASAHPSSGIPNDLKFGVQQLCTHQKTEMQ